MMTKETYYVTQEQLDLIEELTRKWKPLSALLTGFSGGWRKLDNIPQDFQKQVLCYIGGDETIEFKVKEPLYRLWRINNADNKVYMEFNLGTPDWTFYEEYAFTAPLDEIKKWKTPSWCVEEVD